jgi:hypothetical protein
MKPTPLVSDEAPVEDVTEELLTSGIGDGLPIVPPTEVRIERMLADVIDSDLVLGTVPPLFGELTAAAAGYYAVLAGCQPPELPVVLAALKACLETEFNLLGIQTTTGTAAVVVMVHGPIVTDLGFNTGANLLGPGNRVNAAVGRAVALALTGIGGASPGITDMATTGQPGRYTFCLPEPSNAVLPGLAERRGIPHDHNAVTVLAVGGTAEVLPRVGGGVVADVLEPVIDLFAGAALAAGDPTRMAQCEQFVILPPEVATRLATLGMTVESIQHYLFEHGNARLVGRATGVATSSNDVHPLVTGGAGIKMLHLPGWIGASRSVTCLV